MFLYPSLRPCFTILLHVDFSLFSCFSIFHHVHVSLSFHVQDSIFFITSMFLCPSTSKILYSSSRPSFPILHEIYISGTAKMISTEGMMKYEDMLNMLKCGECCELCTPPLVQCRKGHIYCSNCKQNKKLVQCKKCKQTFVDAPNLALDQLVRFIAIPCKYG